MRLLESGSVFLLAVTIVACGGGESRWAGTISDSAGVTIVSNSDIGLWQPGEEWTVEEELRIGALEGDPEYQFGQVGSLAVDSKGRILVLDRQAQHILVYSRDGIYERTIGARGSGPGELNGAMALLMLSGDTLLVPDLRNLRFSRYAPDGSSAGSIPLDLTGGWPMQFRAALGVTVEQIRPGALPEGSAFESRMDVLLRLASDGSVTDTLMTFQSGKSQTFDGHIRFFEAEPVWDLTDHSEIVLGVTNEYRFGVYANGHLERIITKNFVRKPVGEGDESAIKAELDRRLTAQGMPANTRQIVLRDRFHFAEFLPAISALAAGPMGTIWVQHMRPPSELSGEELAAVREDHLEDLGAPEWDVFDAEGRFLGVVTVPDRFTPSLFRDDRIYGVWRDELNVEYVVRLRIVGDLGVGAT